jgi:predicted Rossmann-fold nucleotide-binding protein
MEAAARGAHEKGAKVIGLPMRGWCELTPNRWSRELRWAADYSERLRELLGCDAVVALDGGIGTLTEVAVIWSALQTESDAAQLVLLGTPWKRLLELIGDEFVVAPADLGLVHLVEDLDAAVATVQHLLDDGGDRDRLPRG